MKQIKKGFTLVELMVSIMILIVLGTIGFYQFTKNNSYIRDAARLSQIKELYNGIQGYSLYNRVPFPEDKINITSSGAILGYQGYIGDTLLATIGFSSDGIDPQTGENYTVFMNKPRNKFQILGFLEQEQIFQNSTSYLGEKIFAQDEKYPYSLGDSLGIILDENKNPMQNQSGKFTGNNFDIQTVTENVIIQYSKNQVFSGAMNTLHFYEQPLLSGGKLSGSCKEILDSDPSMAGKDGEYIIAPPKGSQMLVECNMTDNGGGWTRYAEIKSDFSFALAGECYNSYSHVDTPGFYCFNPHRKMVDAKDIMVQINQNYASAQSGDQYVMNIASDYIGVSPLAKTGGTRECSEKNKYMTPMNNGGNTNISFYRIGKSFCGDTGYSREVGGINSSTIMNFGGTGRGPQGGNGITKNRNTTVVPFTFYYR